MSVADGFHREAMASPIRDIATELQGIIGQRLTAYAVGARSPKLVGKWATGTHEPRDEAADRLRLLYRIVRTLGEHYGPDVIRAFLLGANPDLDDRAPIEVIHEGRGIEALNAADSLIRA